MRRRIIQKVLLICRNEVLIGEINEDGISDPYKITFVLKGLADYSVSDAKKRYKNLRKQVG